MSFIDRPSPRWLIFIIDVIICLFSLGLAYMVRFNFHIPKVEIDTLGVVIPFVLSVRIVSFIIAKTYAGIVRFTSNRDAVRIFITISSGSIFFVVANIFSYNFINDKYVVPFSIVIIEYITTIFVLTASRIFVKTMYMELKNPTRAKTSVIIYGAGSSGIITKRTLDRDAGTKYKVIAFVDDDTKKAGKKLEGVTIYHGMEALKDLLDKNNVAHIVISIQNIPAQKKKEIIEAALAGNTKVLSVPPVNNWINGELSFKQIKKIKIEDLLERDPIQLDIGRIEKSFTGKKILVTGAAGSIGSELVRQMIPFNPKQIIILDQAESPLHELELEISEKYKLKNLETVIGDICNVERMRNVFQTFQPEIVFHAAAYKHVPMMELNPSESILTNVKGTKIIADLAVQYRVEKFVMISTDKAVNPTNIMGATKRVAEIYCQSLGKNSETKFITTRFGNVLGSNGSVIPRFRKQIEEGGPITVTDPEITRFFMTISESCQLVLEAGAMGNGGEIFIFDMGNSVKIVDLAKKMVQLSGLQLGKDIQLVFTGLRPGEKLYEELLNDRENTLPTHHPKIMIAKVSEYDFEMIAGNVDQLISLFDTQDNESIVRKMKQIVPEFKSKNSVYEMLDEK